MKRGLVRALCFSLLTGAACSAQGQGLVTRPVLRLDTGSHGTPISRMAVSESASRIATVSQSERIVRIWSLAEGRLLQTLRLPFEVFAGEDQRIDFSPDGTVLAVGHTDQRRGADGRWQLLFRISLLDLNTGRISRTFTETSPRRVMSDYLVFLKDGKHVATCEGSFAYENPAGLSIYRVSDGKPIYADRGFMCAGLAAGPAGKLVAVTSPHDDRSKSNVRIYQLAADGAVSRRQIPLAGIASYGSVDISADGSAAIIGAGSVYEKVDFLAYLVSLTSYSVTAALPRNAIAPIPEFAIARAYFDSKGVPILSIADEKSVARWFSWTGRGQPRPALAQILTNLIVPLADGTVLYSERSRPQRLGTNGRPRYAASAIERNALAATKADIAVNDDGSLVKVMNGAAEFSFDLNRRELGSDGGAAKNAPLESMPGLSVREWEGGTVDTYINGIKAYSINPDGRKSEGRPTGGPFTALSICKDGTALALGTADSGVWSYGRDARQRWSTTTIESGIRALVFTGNCRYIVAAGEDGVLYWIDSRNGEEVARVFIEPASKRWLAWTLSGYYDASPGAEDVVGWSVNRGEGEPPDFFPLSRFRDQYYRPDVISRLVAAGGEAHALASAPPPNVQAILPPAVEIVSPGLELATSSPTVNVTLRVRAPEDAPPVALRVRVDGQLLDIGAQRNLAVAQVKGIHSVTLRVPPRNSEVAFFAENRFGVSPPAVMRVNWRGKPGPAAAAKPRLFVVAVGVSKYKQGEFDLRLPEKDASDFVAWTKTQAGRLYETVDARLLINADASRQNVLSALTWLQGNVTASDVAILFLAGHGVNDPKSGFFFLPHDGDPKALASSAVSFQSLRDTLSNLRGRSIFFVDACHSGNALGDRRPNMTRVVNEMGAAENGVLVFSASTGEQTAEEHASWGNGAFTKYLLEGLNGAADFRKSGNVSYKMLDAFVSAEVPKLTKGRQTPVTLAPYGVPDFALGATR